MSSMQVQLGLTYETHAMEVDNMGHHSIPKLAALTHDRD